MQQSRAICSAPLLSVAEEEARRWRAALPFPRGSGGMEEEGQSSSGHALLRCGALLELWPGKIARLCCCKEHDAVLSH